MAKYGKGAGAFVEKEMHEFKREKAAGKKFGKRRTKSRKQAVAIGLSRARKAGHKVPPKGAFGRY